MIGLNLLKSFLLWNYVKIWIKWHGRACKVRYGSHIHFGQWKCQIEIFFIEFQNTGSNTRCIMCLRFFDFLVPYFIVWIIHIFWSECAYRVSWHNNFKLWVAKKMHMQTCVRTFAHDDLQCACGNQFETFATFPGVRCVIVLLHTFCCKIGRNCYFQDFSIWFLRLSYKKTFWPSVHC